MAQPSVISAGGMRVTAGVLLALVLAGTATAQPGNNSREQYGDRQTGHWGDPGSGSFGNPAAGDFDKSQVTPPPPGTRPLGAVSNGDASAPYVSLPTPRDAAPAASPAKPAKSSSKTAKRKSRKKTAG